MDIAATSPPTRSTASDRIQGRTLHDVSRFIGADPVFIDERIRELELEWDVGRMLEAKAAGMTVAGVLLALTVDRRFLVLPVLGAAFLLQHAFRGWSPPMPLLRGLGIRTRGRDPRRDHRAAHHARRFSRTRGNARTRAGKRARMVLTQTI